MRKGTVSRMRERYAQTVLTFRITYVHIISFVICFGGLRVACWPLVPKFAGSNLIPTKERLAAIRLAETNQCDRCAKVDILIHRLTDCTPSADIWKWTRTRLAAILRSDQRYIPNDWTTRPQCHIWPPPAP